MLPAFVCAGWAAMLLMSCGCSGTRSAPATDARAVPAEPPETDAKAVPAEPPETKPAETEPNAAEPNAAEPAETDARGVPAEPPKTEPPETEPAETKPNAAEPNAAEPAETEPAETEPARTPQLRMRVGAIVIDGPLERDAAREVVRRRWGQYRFCYQEGLKRNPYLEGRVGVSLTIDGSGKTASVQDGGSDIPDDEFKQCIMDAFVALQFPATGTDVLMTVPLAFTTR